MRETGGAKKTNNERGNYIIGEDRKEQRDRKIANKMIIISGYYSLKKERNTR